MVGNVIIHALLIYFLSFVTMTQSGVWNHQHCHVWNRRVSDIQRLEKIKNYNFSSTITKLTVSLAISQIGVNTEKYLYIPNYNCFFN